MEPAERIELLDVLRGFALFGIIQVNFGSNYYENSVASALGVFLFDGTFYPLFSFLFGLGFAIQLMRAEQRKQRFVPRYFWRLVLLLAIGSAHYALIWAGDILRAYALLGIALLLFRKWRPAPLLAASLAALTLSASPSSSDPNPGGPIWRRMNPELVEAARLDRQRYDFARMAGWYDANFDRRLARAEGDYAAWISSGAAEGARMIVQRAYRYSFFREYGDVLAMFLLGLYVARKRILLDLTRHRRLLLAVLFTGFTVGVAGNTIAVFGDWLAGKGLVLPGVFERWAFADKFGNVGLTLAYLAAVTLLYTYRDRARRFLRVFKDVGRMALTNYLAQSVILAMLVGGTSSMVFREGLLDPIGDWWRMLVIQGVFVLQLGYSYVWFQRFRFGPVEWVWRTLTWWKLQPMRVR